MFHLLYFLLIGAVAGWLCGKITRGTGFGFVKNLVVGVIGAIVGGFLFRLIGFHAYGLVADVIVATGGALVFLWALKKFG